MRPVLKKAINSYGLYILLAFVVIISAAVTAVLQRTRERSVVIYSASQNEEQDDVSYEDISSKEEKKSAEKSSNKKTKTDSSSKAPKEKQTKATTTKAAKKSSATKETTEKTTKETTTALEVDFPLDINLATQEELMAIDGVGEVTAADIIGLRENRGIIHNMDELLEISGIGQTKLNKLKQYLYVDEADYIELTTTTTTTKASDEKISETVAATTTTAPSVTEPETPPPQEQPTETEFTEPEIPGRQPVNINSADAETIAECLLIDIEMAENIISTREELGGAYENYLQLLYVKGMSKEQLSEIKDYILLE